MYGFASYAENAARLSASAGVVLLYLVRGICRNRRGCCCPRLCAGAVAAWSAASLVGAGSRIAQGKRISLHCGDRPVASDHHGQCHARRRCALDDGGRVALPQPWWRDWRDLGRSGSSGFHRDQEAGSAVRGGRGPMLADPSLGASQSECRARPLADRGASLCPASARFTIAGGAALGGRIVPVAPCKAWAMGGQL